MFCDLQETEEDQYFQKQHINGGQSLHAAAISYSRGVGGE